MYAKKHGIDPPNEETRDTSILNLAQAMKHSGVSDTTLMRLINEKVLPAKQIAPYAPLEIQHADLDREPVSSILKHLKATREADTRREPVGQSAEPVR